VVAGAGAGEEADAEAEAEAAPLLRLLRRAARLGAPAPRGSTRPHSPAAPWESLKIAWITDVNEASERARERGLLVAQQLGHALCALGRLLGARALVERGGRGLGRADVRWRRAAWVVWKSPSVYRFRKCATQDVLGIVKERSPASASPRRRAWGARRGRRDGAAGDAPGSPRAGREDESPPALVAGAQRASLRSEPSLAAPIEAPALD